MAAKRKLSLFDLTNIVVGSIVGADIYIASALTAGIIGPFAIIVWVVAGICAAILALVFAYCSYYVPRVGGPYAFVTKAFDEFFGFLTGWSMLVAEMLSLPVFAIAFVQYLQVFLPLGWPEQVLVKGLFLLTLTLVNIVGVKAAGRVNDFLTLLKLAPLLLLMVAGMVYFVVHPTVIMGNYTPFLPFGLGGFGTALVLIFWAYVGFEMGTLPAQEVEDPRKNIPRSILGGMVIVSVFYLATNVVVYGVVSQPVLAGTTAPLVLAGMALFGGAGALIMSIGALISVSGSDESNILGTARLSYAMAVDGLFPRAFAELHPRFRTPYLALAIQAVIAFVLSTLSGIAGLITFAVFNLAVSFLLTCLALIVLQKPAKRALYGQGILPWLGVLICGYLLYSASLFDKVAGTLVLLLGIPLYIFFSPKTDIHHLKELVFSEERIFVRRFRRQERFLANFLRLARGAYLRVVRRARSGTR
jgi:APA family basic amino acid/polyamine antiporter